MTVSFFYSEKNTRLQTLAAMGEPIPRQARNR
jgi:hypothetical protein